MKIYFLFLNNLSTKAITPTSIIITKGVTYKAALSY